MALCCTAIFRIRLSSHGWRRKVCGSGQLDGIWTCDGLFHPKIHAHSAGTRGLCPIRWHCLQFAAEPRSIWVYSRGFDSIRPRWGVKGDCICPLPQPTRAPLPPHCWCLAPPATALPSSAARPCPSSTRTPTCCATPHRALACCTWRATTKTRPLPLALRRRRPIPPACSIFLSTRCCADRPSFPSRSRLST